MAAYNCLSIFIVVLQHFNVFKSFLFDPSMTEWLMECVLGSRSPFICRSHRERIRCKPAVLSRHSIQQNECSSFTITAIDQNIVPFMIKAYIQSGDVIISCSPKLKEPIVLTNCYDTIILYIFTNCDGRLRLFAHSFSCCQNWTISSFFAHELGLFGCDSFMQKGTKSLEIQCEIKSLRPDNAYHYSAIFPSYLSTNQPTFSVSFNQQIFKVDKFNCILCLKPFEKIIHLINHINLQHYGYNCEYKSDILVIKPDTNTLKSELDSGMIKFMKRRNTNRLNYKLRRHMPLIDREYNSLNYLEMLTEHSLQQIIYHENKKELEIMREWNKRRIENEDLVENFKSILKTYGLSRETLNLMEILYKGGLIDSKEILDAMNEIKDVDEIF